MNEAMAMVREELGPDAIIISTHRSERGRGVQVMAAIDELPEDEAELLQSINDGDRPKQATSANSDDPIFDALVYHGVPENPGLALLHAAHAFDGATPVEALTGAIDAYFTFDPLEQPADGIIVLVGPPGSGKTSVTAKLAARAAMGEQKILVATTDTVKAGAIHQLKAYTKVLDQELITINAAKSMRSVTKLADGRVAMFVDTPGTNPYDPGEVSDLRAFLEDPRIEPVLVLAAGGDPEDSAEIATVFADLGCRRMIVTRLDATRRIGSILAAAFGADIAIAEISVSPSIARGLKTIGPANLARMIALDPNDVHKQIAPLHSANGDKDK